MVRPATYAERWIQKTPRKKFLNESNISMKKYHHKPTLGVKSGSRSWTPYVEDRNSHDPVMREDICSSEYSEPPTAMAFPVTKLYIDSGFFNGLRRS